jgi:hypothetical protein
MTPLTKEEKQAITALKRIADKWPDTLWLFATGLAVHVMRRGPNGEHVVLPSERGDGAVDPSAIVATIHNLPADGGNF